MSLPRGWAETSLGEVAELIRGVTYRKEDAQSAPAAGLIPLARATNIQAGQLDRHALVFVPAEYVASRQYLQAGDIVVATSSGSKTVVGKAAAAGPEHADMSFGAFCGAIRPSDPGTMDWTRWIFETMEYRAFVESVAIGTNINNLRSRDLESYPICLPPSAEQRRIVAKLDALTARLARSRAEAERSVELARRLRDQIQARGIGAGTILLSELLSAPLRNGLSIKGTDSPPGIPALKLSALRSQSVDLHDVRYLDVETPRAESYRLECDDVLVARGNGTLRLVGRASRVAVVPNDLTIFPDTAFRIRLNPSRASARWFTLIWNSPLVRAQIEARARTTAGIWKISQRDLNEIELPDVAPGDQVEWVASVEAAFARADRLEAEAKKALALIDRLEAAILAKAFRGELVAQDPNDEPASVLLERIRARRAAEPKAKRGRRPKLAS